MKLHWLLLATPLLTSCSERAAGGDVPDSLPAPRQVIVALDLSGSRDEAHRSQARATLERAIDGLGYGDRIVLIQVHQRSAAEGDAVRWSETAETPAHGQPTTLDRERLDAFKQAARSVARSVFESKSAGTLPTTDLFATLYVAAEYVRDAGPRSTNLVLLSDMLQSAHGVEMSSDGGVPSAEWVRSRREAGLLPNLEGACVAVFGADATSEHGARVREFWKLYFQESGATLPDGNYRLIATDQSKLGCS
jgi:hypothetical protein